MMNLSGGGAASLLEQISAHSEREMSASPKCIRASLAAKKNVMSTLAEDPGFSTTSPLTPRASCSPYFETLDPNAPIMESLLKESPASMRQTAPSTPRQPHISNESLVTSENDIELTGRGLALEDIPALEELLRAGRVKRLNLAKNNLGDAGVAALAQALLRTSTQLEYLSLADNGVGESGGLAIVPIVQKQVDLHSLFLAKNNMGPKATAAILAANANRAQPMKGLCGLVLDGA